MIHEGERLLPRARELLSVPAACCASSSQPALAEDDSSAATFQSFHGWVRTHLIQDAAQPHSRKASSTLLDLKGLARFIYFKTNYENRLKSNN